MTTKKSRSTAATEAQDVADETAPYALPDRGGVFERQADGSLVSLEDAQTPAPADQSNDDGNGADHEK